MIEPKRCRASVDVDAVEVTADNLAELVDWLHDRGVSAGYWSLPTPAVWVLDNDRQVAEVGDTVIVDDDGDPAVVRAADAAGALAPAPA